MATPHSDVDAKAYPTLLTRIGPAVVVLCLLLDVSLRFLPSEFFTYRAWEPLVTFANGLGGFAPNTVYHNTKSYGDLANLSNQPRFRQYRDEVFTTDNDGNRNRQSVTRPFSGILLLGDSFVVGSGVSDELTLGEQVGRLAGVRVYNAAMVRDYWKLLNRLQMNHGLVVWEQSERNALPNAASDDAAPPTQVDNAATGASASLKSRVNDYVSASMKYSPLQILSGRAVKRFQNDVVLPNPYRNQAIAATLRNGQEILFLPTELENFDKERPTDPKFFVQLQRQLQERGLGLLVLLVPDKYVVYRNLLQPTPGSGRKPFLDTVEERLVASGVPTLNLTTLFREKAEALFPQREYIYWLDDTHWNAAGIRIAAEAMAQTRAVAECPCR